MAAILFFELGQIYYQASFSSHIAFVQNCKFVFQSEAKIFQRQVFIAINIPCKFGEDMFINERDVKVYAKT